MPVEKGVKGVEKFFLRPLLATEELDIIDQNKVCLTITFSEFYQIPMLYRIYEFVF